MSSSRNPSALRSRRERPAKPALTCQGIIDAALKVLQDEGLSKVTMRRVAAELDTGPASLYVYVRNTEDLHARVLDVLLEPVVARAPSGGTWRERLGALLTGYMQVLSEYPEIARMALSTGPSGPNFLSLAEAILALLDEGGVPDDEAALAIDLLLLYVTAYAAEHSARRAAARPAAEDQARAVERAAADAARYPQIARLRHQLLLAGAPERFDWGLEVVLTGVLSTRHPTVEGEPS